MENDEYNQDDYEEVKNDDDEEMEEEYDYDDEEEEESINFTQPPAVLNTSNKISIPMFGNIKPAPKIESNFESIYGCMAQNNEHVQSDQVRAPANQVSADHSMMSFQNDDVFDNPPTTQYVPPLVEQTFITPPPESSRIKISLGIPSQPTLKAQQLIQKPQPDIPYVPQPVVQIQQATSTSIAVETPPQPEAFKITLLPQVFVQQSLQQMPQVNENLERTVAIQQEHAQDYQPLQNDEDMKMDYQMSGIAQTQYEEISHQNMESQVGFVPDNQAGLVDHGKKKKNKQKKKKIKGKGDILSFYQLDKIKVTMEFEPNDRRARGQCIYKLQLRSDVATELDKIKPEDYKKYQLDFKLQAKQLVILEPSVIHKAEDGTIEKIPLQYEYPDPQAVQAKVQQSVYERSSRDLPTIEQIQRGQYENEQTSSNLLLKKVIVLNLKKEDLISQLPQKVNVLVKYFMPKINEFGIRAIDYKQNSGFALGSNEKLSTYFHSCDLFDSQALWMPLVHSYQYTPINWSFKYIVPKDYTVVASGILFQKTVESSENARAVFHYKIKNEEMAPAFKIGFVIGQFPYIQKLQSVTQVENSHAFFSKQDKHQLFTSAGPNGKFYEGLFSQILSYLQTKLIDAPYPFSSLKLVFVPNLFLKSSRKQSIDFSNGLHIFDEELLFAKTQLESRHQTYKSFASAIAFDYFGAKAYEEQPDDFWLLLGIRESIGNHFKISKFGVLLQRYHIMKTIEAVYRSAKYGFERCATVPMANIPDPNELMLNQLVYQKSELIMHMIESMIDKTFFEKIIRALYKQATPQVSTKLFMKIFKQICGFKLSSFASNWIYSSSCPKLTVSYVYNKKNNSLDLTLTQESAMKEAFCFNQYVNDNLALGELLTRPFVRKDAFNLSSDSEAIRQSLDAIDSMGKFIVEQSRFSGRWFEGEVNVMLYLTDGADISSQQQKMSLKYGEDSVSINIPLNVKVKKTIQNKKKEYERYDQDNNHHNEMDEDDHSQEKRGGDHHMLSSGQKFGMNEYELDGYPITTKTIFEVKNLESSVLWIRVDPDMEYIRKVKVKQEQNNWMFQLLLETDIIGQIESIKELYKQNTQQEFVYQILSSVCTKENYFFKVRKVAMRYIQKMQTSLFSQFIKNEMFFIKIFKDRNFDNSIGFYRSNDFSRILEYYFDKYLLKTLAKCKEVPLAIKASIEEKLAANAKILAPPQVVAPVNEGGNIQISLKTDVAKAVLVNAPKDHMIKTTSDHVAQLLMKLLQENDNSQNFYDDSFFLKQIIKSLGNLDNFKMMAEVAKEVCRQFKLDYIGRFSPQFAITRGAISAYFNIRKQIFLFKNEKRNHVDERRENVELILDQIKEAEDALVPMEQVIDKVVDNHGWPYEVRYQVAKYRVKHCFLYQKNEFLKALYLQLKVVDNFQALSKFRDAIDYMDTIATVLEENVERLDYREALLDSPRAEAIANVLFKILCMPVNYLTCSLQYQVKRVYYFIYGSRVPASLAKWQKSEGISTSQIQYDPYWAQSPGLDAGNIKDLHAKSRQQKQQPLPMQVKSPMIVIKPLKEEPNIVQQPRVEGRMDKFESKLRISLPIDQNPQPLKPSQPIKIMIGNHEQTSRTQNTSIALPNFQADADMMMKKPSDFEVERLQNQKLLQSLSLQDNRGNQDEMMADDDDESIYDEFAAISFPEIEWLQRIWDITGHLWYHEESQAFLNPVTIDDLGVYFQDYINTIDFPTDLTTIKEKIKTKSYNGINEWLNEVRTMFKNCMNFNDESSEIHKSAIKLQRFFNQELRQYGINAAVPIRIL